MTISIENETNLYTDYDFQSLIEKVINAAADYVNCPFEITVNVMLTDDEDIHSINKSERNIDRATDVLSFPAIEYEEPGNLDFISDEDDYYFDLDLGELILGDIVISLETAERQAKDYNHSFTREIAFLVAHSMLHLFGYDHMEDDERIEMERMQEEILEGINITRNYE